MFESVTGNLVCIQRVRFQGNYPEARTETFAGGEQCNWVRKLHISNAERLDVGTQCLCASGGATFERVF